MKRRHRSSDTLLAGARMAGEWLLVALVVGAALAAVVVPRLAGAKTYEVSTGSMRPTMPPGTLVIVRRADSSDLEVGDVITFMPRPDDPSVVTHRIVGVGYNVAGDRAFRTRGDANPSPDIGMVQAKQVVGKRWYSVPYLGYATVLLTGRQREVGVLLGSGGLFAYALVMFAGAVRDRLRRPHGGPEVARA